MRNLRVLAALGLLTAAGAANAQVSSTWTATNDYDFRGYSQSATDPALQGSIDYAHDSGWYIGAWASNVDFGDGVDADVELDIYTGFSGGEDLTWSAGIVYYTYPGSDDVEEYPEIFAGLGYGPVSGKIWYSNDFYASDESAFYLEANGTFELPSNFSILAHAGYSYGDFWDDINGDKVIDYSLGVGYKAGNFNLALKYVDTDSDTEITDDVLNNEGRVIFTIATTFPWSNE
jgi:uncharacterized protein (TIGR02001 family)